MAEFLELANKVAGFAVVVETLVEVVRTEIMEPCGRVREEMPDHDHDRSFDSDKGFGVSRNAVRAASSHTGAAAAPMMSIIAPIRVVSDSTLALNESIWSSNIRANSA